MGYRQYGALHAPRSAIFVQRLAEDQWTVSYYDRAAGSGSVQAGQRPRDVPHGAGYMRDSVQVSGVCRAEVRQGEVDGKIMENGGGWKEESMCLTAAQDGPQSY
jgi:hypothetical protein